MLKTLFTVFISIFIAELGDKTQIAVLLFSTEKEMNKVLVFVSASLAMVAATLIGVIVGSKIGIFIPERALKIVAGIGFIAIGIWVLISSK